MAVTLGQMREECCWMWVQCKNWKCLHKVPVAIVPLIIRWGASTDNEMLRQCARCSKCGRRGVDLQHPSWAGSDIGWAPFPVSRMADPPA